MYEKAKDEKSKKKRMIPKEIIGAEPEWIKQMKENYGKLKKEQASLGTRTEYMKVERPDEKTTGQHREDTKDQKCYEPEASNDDENQQIQKMKIVT